jgi:hypothetical protein
MQDTDDIDIDAILAQRKQIAFIWSVEDVKEVRPDLTDELAWEVLQHVGGHHDAEQGANWLTLELAAEDLFGESAEIDAAEEE